ncbi:MAG: hypothetical protein R2685_08080 [Candidatus Nitrosocosmicus sp.]|nr:hypothetical protein [Candidatus Nitrosocosmicus sp.]
MASCKGICTRFKVDKSKGRDKSPYLFGNKRCSVCNVYVLKDFPSLYCPCCGMKFRIKPAIKRKIVLVRRL